MTAEQQLERSVLEGKERDELHAIAQALSVKTNTRTKKADMIDGILKATGVPVDPGSSDAAPAATNGDSRSNGSTGTARRGRSPRANSTPADDGQTPDRPTARPHVVSSFAPEDDLVVSTARVDLDEDFDIPTANGSSAGGDGGLPGTGGGAPPHHGGPGAANW